MGRGERRKHRTHNAGCGLARVEDLELTHSSDNRKKLSHYLDHIVLLSKPRSHVELRSAPSIRIGRLASPCPKEPFVYRFVVEVEVVERKGLQGAKRAVVDRGVSPKSAIAATVWFGGPVNLPDFDGLS